MANARLEKLKNKLSIVGTMKQVNKKNEETDGYPYYSMEREKVDKRIKDAGNCGIAWGVLTVIFSFPNFALKDLLGALLVFALTFGIYKKSRACAIAIFILWFLMVAGWIAALLIGPLAHKNLLPILAIIGIPFVGALTYFFLQGIRGIFAYHKLTKFETRNNNG